MKARKSLFAKMVLSALVVSSLGFGATQAFAESKPRHAACPAHSGCVYGGYWTSGTLICCQEW